MASIKNRQEIKYIKKACKITDSIFKKLLKELKRGHFKTEKQIYRYLLDETKKLALKPAFKPIVASGINAVNPHHPATNFPLKKGFLIIDYGVRYKGYCADMTRTFYLGKPTKYHIKLYQKVLDVQNECIKISIPGKSCKKLHNFAAKNIKYLVHGLGHGLGKKIHEKPKINSKSGDFLKKDMIITIEPGYYHKIGIRIEDSLLIKRKKPKILTKFPKKLIIIENYP
jgi:Xaa-Pro aminopeptidase